MAEQPKINLPSSAENFQQILQLLVAEKIIPKINDLPSHFQKTLKYAVPCLANGRSFNQVKIIIAGDNNTHKRAVLSLLIENKLPYTSIKVTPNGVRYYSDSLELSDDGDNIKVGVIIDMVDICSKKSFEIKNHVSNASKTYVPNYAVRKITPQIRKLGNKCRPVEYPNLVLYFACSEIALQGKEQKNSKGIKKEMDRLNFQLSQLHKMNLVDTKANNLVLIMIDGKGTETKSNSQNQNTSANNQEKSLEEVDMGNKSASPQATPSTSKSITREPTKQSIFQKQSQPPVKYATIQNMIRKQLKDVYVLTGEVLVLFLDQTSLPSQSEGFTADFNPSLRESILKSMIEVFTRNNDTLGLLLLSKKLCDGPVASDIMASLDLICEKTSLNTTTLMSIFGSDNVHPESSQLDLYHRYKQPGFHSIGQAYCPVSETLKMQNVFSKKSMNEKVVSVGETMFYIPQFVDMFLDVSTESWSLAHDDKKSYELFRKSEYGIEKGVKLTVDSSLNGNWNSSSDDSDVSDAVLHEVRLAFLQVMNPDDNFSDEIKNELRELSRPCRTSYPTPITPTLRKSKKEIKIMYMDMMDNRYNEFFAKWGTHFIVKQWIGGFIKTNYTENKHTLQNTWDVFSKLLSKVFCIGNRDLNVGISSKASLFSVKKGGKLGISGHEHDDLMYLEFDKITPELYYSWVNEVKTNPNALNYSVILYPYYNSKFCLNKNEMRQRTMKYLATKNKEPVGCFPTSTMIRLFNGQEKSIDELKAFDPILTISMNSANSHTFTSTRFLTFLHFERKKKTEFLVLTFSNGKSLKVTKNHLLVVLEQAGNAPVNKQAQYMKVGDRMIYVNKDKKILATTLEAIEIEESYGMFCPLTSTGSFLADGFLVTSYASVDNFSVAHKAMIPLRLWYNFKFVVKKILRGNQQDEQKLRQGVHKYAKFLVWIRRFF